MQPGSPSRPEITVAITAYNRREFVVEAMRSALDQSLERSRYEVILVKNYSDKVVDDYAAANGVRLVFCDEKEIGEMTWAAIKSASGEVISFLDDDDLFTRDKLDTVSRVMRDRSIGYYHNNVGLIDDPGRRPLLLRQPRRSESLELSGCDPSRLLNSIDAGAAFNSSSISVRKDILAAWEDLIRKTSSGPGFTLYLIFLASSRAFIDVKPLTLFRAHASRTEDEMIGVAAGSIARSLATLNAMAGVITNETCMAVVDYKTYEFQIRDYLYGSGDGATARLAASKLARSPLSFVSPFRLAPITLAFLWPMLPRRLRMAILTSSAL